MITLLGIEEQWSDLGVAVFLVFSAWLIVVAWIVRRYDAFVRMKESMAAPVVATSPGFDDFGSLPVRNREQRMLLAFMYMVAQEDDYEDDVNADLAVVSPVSYVAGRYPEPNVQHMMLNGRDMVLNDAQRQEMEVWGTINGVPIEDFDDWRG